MTILKENGLELISLSSKIILIDEEITDIHGTTAKYINDDSYVVVYQTNGVLIGKYKHKDRNFHFYQNEEFNPSYILKMRIFDNKSELLLWRTDNKIKGRIRIDNEGNSDYAVDAYQQVWGTDYKKLNGGFTKIFEERGTELILPFSKIKVDNEKSRIFIKTRNYIDFHIETHLATYVDCRFIGFYDKDKNELKEV